MTQATPHPFLVGQKWELASFYASTPDKFTREADDAVLQIRSNNATRSRQLRSKTATNTAGTLGLFDLSLYKETKSDMNSVRRIHNRKTPRSRKLRIESMPSTAETLKTFDILLDKERMHRTQTREITANYSNPRKPDRLTTARILPPVENRSRISRAKTSYEHYGKGGSDRRPITIPAEMLAAYSQIGKFNEKGKIESLEYDERHLRKSAMLLPSIADTLGESSIVREAQGHTFLINLGVIARNSDGFEDFYDLAIRRDVSKLALEMTLDKLEKFATSYSSKLK